MALHIRCFELRREGAILNVTMQFGEIEPGSFGVKLKLGRVGNRKGAVAHSLGFAQLNKAGEIIKVPPEAELTDSERDEIEGLIKAAAL